MKKCKLCCSNTRSEERELLFNRKRQYIESKPNVLQALLLRFPKANWDFYELARNPNISEAFMKANPQFPWNADAGGPRPNAQSACSFEAFLRNSSICELEFYYSESLLPLPKSDPLICSPRYKPAIIKLPVLNSDEECKVFKHWASVEATPLLTIEFAEKYERWLDFSFISESLFLWSERGYWHARRADYIAVRKKEIYATLSEQGILRDIAGIITKYIDLH
jgi:hypothetical protein